MNEAQEQKKEQLQKGDIFSDISFVQEARKKKRTFFGFQNVSTVWLSTICSARVRRASWEAIASFDFCECM